MHAGSIRRVTDPGSGWGDPATKTELSEGIVEAISAASVTISGSSGGGASFKQTFTIDSETRVVGRGVGTAAAARGGKPVITDLIKTGDHVTVSYSKTDKTLHAREIRVRATPK
jgi:hypothetical protein